LLPNCRSNQLPPSRWQMQPYRTSMTYPLMESTIPTGFDVVVHAAAVSDYALAGVFAKNDRGEMMTCPLPGEEPTFRIAGWFRLTEADRSY
jgi:hypothetical protein